MKYLPSGKINQMMGCCSLSSPEDTLWSAWTLAPQVCWGCWMHWFQTWDPAANSSPRLRKKEAVPRGNRAWSVWRRKASHLAEPKSSGLHFPETLPISRLPLSPFWGHITISGQWKPKPPDGLQHGKVLDIPDHSHSGWFGPTSRAKPRKPSVEPKAFTVSWPPLSSMSC